MNSAGGNQSQAQSNGKWLIALDLDGTVIDRDDHASSALIETIAQARVAGHEVMIVTGRPVHGTLHVYRDLGLTSAYAICSNGAVTIKLRDFETAQLVRFGDNPPYEIADKIVFNPGPIIDIIEPALPDADFAVEDADQGYRSVRPFRANTFGANLRIVDEENFRSSPVTRVVVVSPEHNKRTAEFHRIVSEIGLHDVSYSIGRTAWLDIAPFGVNKATTLEDVRRKLGIPRQRVLAVGDGLNDIQMLQWAADGGGISAAMGGARDEVIASASHEVADLAHDGAAQAIQVIL